IQELRRPRLRPVVNATGVILHTNLGRAPLAAAAAEAAAAIAGRHSTLEFDPQTGRRGRRHDLAADLLCHLSGAEGAAVVNNCAAAVLLMLTALAKGKEVIVARGELVEIGGGFRMPDVMRLSGARMVEVGTTNRTRAADYAAAITPRTAAIMKVHASNFQVIGFTESVALAALIATLDLYVTESFAGLPIWNMLGASAVSIEARAREWQRRLSELGAAVDVVPAESTVGGGSLPGERLATTVLALTPGRRGANDLLRRLRESEPPVIGRIEQDRVLLDPRTVLPGEDDVLLEA